VAIFRFCSERLKDIFDIATVSRALSFSNESGIARAIAIKAIFAATTCCTFLSLNAHV
jgi:hypothetical protein